MKYIPKINVFDIQASKFQSLGQHDSGCEAASLLHYLRERILPMACNRYSYYYPCLGKHLQYLHGERPSPPGKKIYIHGLKYLQPQGFSKLTLGCCPLQMYIHRCLKDILQI
jgi:hypothetical protein